MLPAPRRRKSTTLPSSHAALGREECSKVSCGDRKAPEVFVKALALLLEHVENLIESVLCLLHKWPSKAPRRRSTIIVQRILCSGPDSLLLIAPIRHLSDQGRRERRYGILRWCFETVKEG